MKVFRKDISKFKSSIKEFEAWTVTWNISISRTLHVVFGHSKVKLKCSRLHLPLTQNRLGNKWGNKAEKQHQQQDYRTTDQSGVTVQSRENTIRKKGRRFGRWFCWSSWMDEDTSNEQLIETLCTDVSQTGLLTTSSPLNLTFESTGEGKLLWNMTSCLGTPMSERTKLYKTL